MVLRDYSKLAHGESKGFMPSPYVNYRLKPDFVRIVEGGQVTTHNESGFRETLPVKPKRSSVMRIVCLGGSTTYGAGVSDNSLTYPSRLNELLKTDRYRPAGWSDVEVLNLGVGGYTSAEVLSMLHFYALPLEPEAVLIQVALNDVAPRFYDDFDLGYEHFRKVMQPEEAGWAARLLYRSRLVVVLGWGLGVFKPQTLQARTQYPLPAGQQALVNLEHHGTEAFRRNLKAAVALARDSGVQVWLLTEAALEVDTSSVEDQNLRALENAYQKGLDEHQEVIRQLAQSEQVGLIDLARQMPQDPIYFTDMIHMSPAGNQVKAEIIANALHNKLPMQKKP